MNIIELINKIKEVALTQKTVNSVFDGDVYENWNNHEIKYASVNIGLQSITNNDNISTYSLILYYGDRLLQDKANTKSIYIDGVNTLQSIINILNNIDFIDISESVTYTPFEQKFNDYLAGVYCQVTITTDSTLGLCSLDDYVYISDKDNLIESIIEQINKTDDEILSNLLQTIIYKLNN